MLPGPRRGEVVAANDVRGLWGDVGQVVKLTCWFAVLFGVLLETRFVLFVVFGPVEAILEVGYDVGSSRANFLS